MHCYQTQPEGNHNGTFSGLLWLTLFSKFKHEQVHARNLSLSHMQKHIGQGTALRTAAQLGSSTEEAALQQRSRQTPD